MAGDLQHLDNRMQALKMLDDLSFAIPFAVNQGETGQKSGCLWLDFCQCLAGNHTTDLYHSTGKTGVPKSQLTTLVIGTFSVGIIYWLDLSENGVGMCEKWMGWWWLGSKQGKRIT